MMARFVSGTAVVLALATLSPAARAATGPAPVRMEVAPTLSHHVIFRPAALPRAGSPGLPVVVFAGGGCRNAGARFTELLSEVASHGYYVISLGRLGNPALDRNPDHEPDYAGGPTKTDVSQIDYAVKWAQREAARTGGPLKGKLDLSRLALMGQSCGGVQSLDAAARLPGVATLVVLNSGLFPDDRQMGGSEIKRADLPKITAPTLILLGGKGDVAFENGHATFDGMAAPAFLASADYGHRATYFSKDGGLFGTVVMDWLRWRLGHSATAAARFAGSDCGLCRDSQWTVRSRGLAAGK